MIVQSYKSRAATYYEVPWSLIIVKHMEPMNLKISPCSSHLMVRKNATTYETKLSCKHELRYSERWNPLADCYVQLSVLCSSRRNDQISPPAGFSMGTSLRLPSSQAYCFLGLADSLLLNYFWRKSQNKLWKIYFFVKKFMKGSG